MLLLLEKPLKAAGFKILRLDGSMTAKKRLDVIQQFAHVGPDAPTVLLASLKAAGAGVNLTAASTVYLFDPWWNPGIEDQAMDRVHRIGQKKEVKVIRLIVKGSIEERILSLQERRKRLITNAFGKQGGKDDKEMRVGRAPDDDGPAISAAHMLINGNSSVSYHHVDGQGSDGREDIATSMDFGPLVNMLGGIVAVTGMVELRTRRGLFKCSA